MDKQFIWKHKLEKLKDVNNYRKLDTLQISIDHNFSSNDYLGILTNDSLREEFYNNYLSNSFSYLGSGSSRLLSGNHYQYTLLEKKLTSLYQKECLILNSGYHANSGILPALVQRNDLIIADHDVHASIIDGIILSRCKFLRYRHNDYQHLIKILEKYRYQYNNVFIVTEALFSMDGTCANLSYIVEIKERYKCYLYIDEAHSFGTFGKEGLGLAMQNKLVPKIDIIIGTFGKAIGSLGAFCVTSSIMKDFLVNRQRTLIFTTALPPINVAWTNFIIQKLPEFKTNRDNLWKLTDIMHEYIVKNKIKTSGNTYIIPIILGENLLAIQMAQELQKSGYFVKAIRPPTVPPNKSCIRISLRADMKLEEIEKISYLIKNIYNNFAL